MGEVTETMDAPFDDVGRPLFGVRGSTREDEANVGEVDDEPGGRLDGALALVTGATGLLGAAMASELTSNGASVLLLGRDRDALTATAADLGAGARTAMLRCDLASSEDVSSAVDFVERLDRPVDLVVHAAGLHAPARISDGPVELLDEHYLLNVRGPYLLSQRLLPLLRERSAQFVFFATPDSGAPTGGDVHHRITQAATRELASELRSEAAPRGVRVVTVLAGDEPTSEVEHVDHAAFVASLSQTVVDSLADPDVDVTELAVRTVSRPVRSEQR